MAHAGRARRGEIVNHWASLRRRKRRAIPRCAGHDAVRRAGGRGKRVFMFGERLAPSDKRGRAMKFGRHTRTWLPNETMTRSGASRISVEGRLAEKERLGALGRHDRDILLIRGNEHADAPGVRSADQHGARERAESASARRPPPPRSTPLARRRVGRRSTGGSAGRPATCGRDSSRQTRPDRPCCVSGRNR